MVRLVFLVLILIFTYANVLASDITYGNIANVIFIDNYDGDTFSVNIPNMHPIVGSNISIRINGIDTPELKSKCYKEQQLATEAKIFLHDLLTNARVINLYNIRRDKYFRILANVFVDGIEVSNIMLDNHLAVVYNGETKKNWCE